MIVNWVLTSEVIHPPVCELWNCQDRHQHQQEHGIQDLVILRICSREWAGWMILVLVVGSFHLVDGPLAVSDSLPFAWSVGCLSLYIVPLMAPAQDKVMGLPTPLITRIEFEENLMVHIAISSFLFSCSMRKAQRYGDLMSS